MPNKKKHIVIVGAGPGGLCAGMLLAHQGFRVSIYEKNETVGGRNRPINMNGFTFDTGPTFLLMKFVLDEMFALCGRRAEDYMEFAQLDPMYRLIFDDREVFISSDHDKMCAEMRRAFPEGDAGFNQFLHKEEERYHALYPCIQKDYSSLLSFLSLSLIRALPKLAITHSVFSNLGQYFKEEKARLAFSFQSKYLGMSPWKCPALFTMLPLIEHKYGIHHVMGGLNRISAGMAKVIEEFGGEIYTSTSIESLLVDNRTVKGVRLASGEEVLADEVIINADFAHAMSKLVPDGILRKYHRETLRKKEYSCSTFMMYLGLKRKYDIAHHNIVFAKDYETNTNNTFDHKLLSDDFSFYVQNPSITDASLAPSGKSALYVLVPVPNNLSQLPWGELQVRFREQVLDTLEQQLGLHDIREQIECEKIIHPGTWETSETVFLGATFSLSHKFSQLLYWRPRNRFE
ncbi:MAG: phytoene desaturase family protein, partial [Methylococcaceae bacterium]